MFRIFYVGLYAFATLSRPTVGMVREDHVLHRDYSYIVRYYSIRNLMISAII
jgi:hypothetical protein